MFRIQGVFRTISPMHISMAGVVKVSLEGDRVYGNTTKSFPCTPVQKIPFRSAEGGTMNIPTIPANKLRGGLRRACARVIFDHLVDVRKESLSGGAYRGMVSGAVTGNPDGIFPTLSEIREANDHPFFGLFGGGPRLLPSNLRVDTAIPMITEMEEFLPGIPGLVGTRHKLVETLFFRRVDDLLQLSDLEYVQKAIKDPEQAYQEWNDFVKEGKKKKADKSKKGNEKAKAVPTDPSDIAAPVEAASETDSEDDKSRGVFAFSATEIVVPGTNFAISYEMLGDYAHLGLLLKGLQRQFATELMGSMSRIGFGRYIVSNLRVSAHGGPDEPIFKEVTADARGHARYEFNMESETVASALAAFEEALQSVNADGIERLMKSLKKPEDESDSDSKKSKKVA